MKFNNVYEQLENVPKNDYFDNPDFKKFKNEILEKYNKKYEIKKLFSTNLLFYYDPVYFENIKTLENYYQKHKNINYDYTIKEDSFNKFQSLILDQTKENIQKIYNEYSEYQEKLFIKLNINNYKKVLNKIKENEHKKNVNFILEINEDIFSNKKYKEISLYIKEFFKTKNNILNTNPVYLELEINKETFHIFQDLILQLYEESMQFLRFYNFKLDYYYLKDIKLEELNSFEFYFSFLYKWMNNTIEQNKNSLNISNSFKSNTKKEIFVQGNGDVYINKKFYKQNKNKLFNIENDFGKNGEEMPFYENNLLWQILIINSDNFIKHIQQNKNYVIYPEILDYYYNFQENGSIQNLQPEIEVFHMIIYKIFNNRM